VVKWVAMGLYLEVGAVDIDDIPVVVPT